MLTSRVRITCARVCAMTVVAVLTAFSPPIAFAQSTRTWTHVQTSAGNMSGGRNTVAFSAPTTAGNLIVVQVSWTGGSTFSSLTDSQGNAFTPIGSEQYAASFDAHSRLYYAANIRGGADAITSVVIGSPPYHELYIHEYAGLDPNAPLEAFVVQVGSGSTFSSGLLTTATEHALLYAIEIDAHTGIAAGGWTTRTTFNGNVAADAEAASPGTYNFTGQTSGAYIAWLVAFKQPTVGPPPDTTAPSVPAGLTARATSTFQIDLTWSGAVDNVAVVGYTVFRDGIPIGGTATPAYSDTGLTPGTLYTYSVVAYDAAKNNSARSPEISVRTHSLSNGPSYSTAFSDTGSPLSENGRWLNGKQIGLDWTDVATIPGLAYGTQSGFNGFDDSIAIVQGSWGPNQTATATVHTVNQQGGETYEEVELLLRWSLSAHSATGYEVLFGLHAERPYMQIVRWNGAFGDYTVLASVDLQQGIADGDIVRATAIGTIITAYVNDVPVLAVEDSSFANGSPGIGFFLQGSALNTDFGFTSFAASSNSGPNAPSIPTGVSATALSSSEVSLVWNASSGVAAPVVGYKVFRDGVEIDEATTTAYTDTGLLPSTSYAYSVAAYDSLGNTSAQSAPARATTDDTTGRTWQHVQSSADDSGARSNAVAFSGATTRGNLILVEVHWSEHSNFISLSDSQGNTFVPVGDEQRSALFGMKSRLFYAPNIRGGEDTITTIVTGSPEYHALFFHEYSGLDPIAPLDGFSVIMAEAQTFATGTVATTAAHDLLYGIEIDWGVGTAASGWTTRSVATDADAPNAGTYTFAGRPSGGYIAWLAAFKQVPAP